MLTQIKSSTIESVWNDSEKQVIAEVVNQALELNLNYTQIIGCVKKDSDIQIIWKAENTLYSFWFGTSWMQEQVKSKRAEKALFKACTHYQVKAIASDVCLNTFVVEKSNVFLAVIGFANQRWWMISRSSASNIPVYFDCPKQAIASLWCLEVGVIK
jgi:hypothetical protein